MQINILTNKQNETVTHLPDQYARCIAASKRIRWDIDLDVFRDRQFNFDEKFLPDGLSLINDLKFVNELDQRFLSQIQGRTYANIFGLVERFINAKVLEVSQQYVLGNQVALESLIRFSDEELKHQEMFRRIETMTAQGMPAGYSFYPDPDEVAKVVLGKSTWAVLGLTCHIELFTQQHYKQSIENNSGLSDLYKDVFLYHWKEESQHAILDELEWRDENTRLSSSQREQAVTDLIDLVVAVDGILQMQASVDADYFIDCASASFSDNEEKQIQDNILKAYRWQYIVSGVKESKFTEILGELTSNSQMTRIVDTLAPLM